MKSKGRREGNEKNTFSFVITPMLLVNDNLHVHKSHTKIQPLFLHFHHVSISHKEKKESLQSLSHSKQNDHQSIPSPFLHFLPMKPHSLIYLSIKKSMTDEICHTLVCFSIKLLQYQP